MPRLFFALTIPEDLRQRAASVAPELKRTGLKASWVPAENYHFTMKFLGEIREEDIPGLEDRARVVAAETSPFHIEMRGAGAFPSPRKPRVLWLGGRADSDAPNALALELERIGESVGVTPERRPFRLHLTIARIRDPHRVPRELATALQRLAQDEFGGFLCRELTLLASELGDGPARYSPRSTFPFS